MNEKHLHVRGIHLHCVGRTFDGILVLLLQMREMLNYDKLDLSRSHVAEVDRLRVTALLMSHSFFIEFVFQWAEGKARFVTNDGRSKVALFIHATHHSSSQNRTCCPLP